MELALTVGLSLLAVLGLVLGLRAYLQSLRARGAAEIGKRYPEAEVLLTQTLAQSFGQQSRGKTQARGSGALALTARELFFLLYVPERALRIPLSTIQAVSLVRSHLGKTQGAQLLHVRFTADGVEDAIAWRVPDPEAWRTKLESLL